MGGSRIYYAIGDESMVRSDYDVNRRWNQGGGRFYDVIYDETMRAVAFAV